MNDETIAGIIGIILVVFSIVGMVMTFNLIAMESSCQRKFDTYDCTIIFVPVTEKDLIEKYQGGKDEN